jgi:alpha-1,2-glucosyltransferase
MMSIYYLIVGLVVLLTYQIVQELIVDEVFHVVQVQKYCSSSLEYNDKITTPPGLYIITWLWFKLLNCLYKLDCTIAFTRLTNVAYGMMMPLILKKLLQHQDAAVEISMFPVSFFFHFLYYTDSGSTFWVLSSLLESRKKRYTRAALCSFIGIWYRQTNIVWMLFIMGHSVAMMQVNSKNCTLINYIQFAMNNMIIIIKKLWGFVMNVIMFTCFLYWNKGIVIGDKMNHTVAIHIPQIYYFSVFALFFSWDFQLFYRAMTRMIGPIDLVLIMAMVWTILEFTIEHPFLLADNRHFSFYIWRWFFKGNLTMRLLVVPVYFLALRGTFTKMSKYLMYLIKQDRPWTLSQSLDTH